MMDVVSQPSIEHNQLLHCAQFNIGRAFYEGFGVNQSDREAEKWWLLAAQDGEPNGCVKAQTVLGMFYSRSNEENFNIKKVRMTENIIAKQPVWTKCGCILTYSC